jgi:hypothetical protein
MIEQFQITARGEAPNSEDFAQFMVKKCYFKRSGNDFEKIYILGKDFRESIQLKINYQPEQGAFGSWQIFDQARKGLLMGPDARATAMFKWSERLKDVAMRLEGDLLDIEKFIKGQA